MTEFEENVYKITKTIPKGKITTYKLIAIAINKPKSCMAVGNALAKNPYSIDIVPCHRVVSSKFILNGYFGSKNINKRIKILKSEGIIFDDNNNIIIDDNIIYDPTK